MCMIRTVVFLYTLFCLFGKSHAAYGADDGWVDLGLPSGVLWATCNLGANSPEESGDYCIWGENIYDLSRYSIYDENNNRLPLRTDMPLLPIGEGIVVTLGCGARIPTAEEWKELIDNTRGEWKELNGVFGMELTGGNGNSLFLPASGCTLTGGEGTIGYYWSSSLYWKYSDFGRGYFFNSEGFESSVFGRLCGMSVRPVCSVAQ